MTAQDKPMRILADAATAQRIVGSLNRRGFLAAVGGAGPRAPVLPPGGGGTAQGGPAAPTPGGH